MAFDGRNYTAPPMIPPRAYHPGAPVSAELFQSVMQAAYYAHRNENILCQQLILGQEAGQRVADYPGSIGFPRQYDYTYTGTTFTKYASAYKYIPSIATTLRAMILVELYARPDSTATYSSARFRFNGATSTGGDTSFGGDYDRFDGQMVSRLNKLDELPLQILHLTESITTVCPTGVETWIDIEGHTWGLVYPHWCVMWWTADDT